MPRKSESHNIIVACLVTALTGLCICYGYKGATRLTAPKYNRAAIQETVKKEEKKTIEAAPGKPYDMPRVVNIGPAFDVTPWKYCYNPERQNEELYPTLVFQPLQTQARGGKHRNFFSAGELGIRVNLTSEKFDGIPDAAFTTKDLRTYMWDIDSKTGEVREIVKK